MPVESVDGNRDQSIRIRRAARAVANGDSGLTCCTGLLRTVDDNDRTGADESCRSDGNDRERPPKKIFPNTNSLNLFTRENLSPEK